MNKKIGMTITALAVFSISMVLGYNFLNTPVNAAEEIMVYKSPTCGCCNNWVKHLESEGFNVKTKNMSDLNLIKDKFGVKAEVQSCHTAKVGNYFIEGHVPAADIKKLLKDKPDIKGLSVPGMVTGSPGMEGDRKDPYDVIAIDKNNNYSVYSRY